EAGEAANAEAGEAANAEAGEAANAEAGEAANAEAGEAANAEAGEAEAAENAAAPKFLARTSTTARAKRRAAKAPSTQTATTARPAPPPKPRTPRARRRWMPAEDVPRASDAGLLVTGGLGGAIALLAYRLLFFSLVTGSFTEGRVVATVLAVDGLVAPLVTALPFYGLMSGSDDWDYGFTETYLGAGLVNLLLLAAALGAGQNSETAASAILFADLFIVPLAAVITGAWTREIGEGARPVWSEEARKITRPPDDASATLPPLRTPFAARFSF
ncbi:MAG: hypothetical protein RMA76_13085, partial [Deltaproteobacteria bacterium]